MAETNQRIILTKRMLSDGLLRLLKAKPLDKINVTELCRESGINRATFYRHYEVPRDILTEMQTDFTEKLLRQFRSPLGEHEKDIENFFNELHKNADLVKLFIQYNTEGDWARLFDHFYHTLCVRDLLPEFEDLDEDSTRLLLTYISGGAYFMMREWLLEDIPKSPKEISDLALKILRKKADRS